MNIKELCDERFLERTKKKRKCAAKVRTGCKTCKIRRVKCDEGKPACQRCIKWGGPSQCDGYDDPPDTAYKIVVKTGQRELLPNPIPLCRTPMIKKFDNDEEYSFFQRFCVESTVQLTGSTHSELWNRVVLQASEMDPSVRHAVVAIGALDFQQLSHGGTDLQSIHREFTFQDFGALTAVGLINSSPWSKKVKDGERRGRKIAYEEYGKAIASLRKAVIEKRSDITTRLVSCVLFILFEVYHGNSESAVGQTYAGIRMLEEHEKQRREWTPSQKTVKPPVINPEILETFALLTIQATGWTDKNRPDTPPSSKDSQKAFEEIPNEFTSLKHAAFILSTIMLKGTFLRFRRAATPYPSPKQESELATCEPVYHVGPEHSELTTILNRFRQWNVAFTPFMRRTRTEHGKHLRKGAILLKMHFLASYLWTASGAPLQAMYYQRYTNELAEVVSLAKILSSEGILVPRMVLPLMIVGWNYKHRKLRQEVISIFNMFPGRAGTWDATMIAKVTEWVIELEEEGLTDEEYVPMNAIANIVNLQLDTPNRTVFVEAIQAKEGNVVRLNTTLQW